MLTYIFRSESQQYVWTMPIRSDKCVCRSIQNFLHYKLMVLRNAVFKASIWRVIYKRALNCNHWEHPQSSCTRNVTAGHTRAASFVDSRLEAATKSHFWGRRKKASLRLLHYDGLAGFLQTPCGCLTGPLRGRYKDNRTAVTALWCPEGTRKRVLIFASGLSLSG